MNKILLLLLLIFSSALFANDQNPYIPDYLSYVDPLPGAEYVNCRTTIIFTPASELKDETVFSENSIKITGSKNGNYKFTISKNEKYNTYIIKPLKCFQPGEIVSVKFNSSVKTKTGKRINEPITSFKVSKEELPQKPLLGLVNELPESMLKSMLNAKNQFSGIESFPQITVNYWDNPAEGSILLSNIVLNVQIPNTPYLFILKNDGTPVFTREMAGQIFNFDRQPNGNFTYYNRVGGKYYELDSSYTLIDSFFTGNGYQTDLHELRVLPNGNAYLMSYDRRIVDMSLIIAGGNPNAIVTGLIIQEIDNNKNVIFQWKSWDHIPITDATHENLLAAEIDYIHGNAIEIDTDGNILLSSRHLDEITKINRSNGNIIWRLGGKKNQFSFTNDPIKFSHQHGIRRLQNGHIIMFDNGNFHSPPFSRAVEYVLNETNMTASIFWEYRNSPAIFGYAMGFAQRLENGNTLISWGATSPALTEVRPNGTKTLVISFSPNVMTYRSLKYNLSGNIVNIVPVNNEIPLKYDLAQNYPNPFNPITKFKFQLPVSGMTKIEIYDVLGRVVSTPVNNWLAAGNYETEFNGVNLFSGIYFYRLSAGNYSETKKMIMIK